MASDWLQHVLTLASNLSGLVDESGEGEESTIEVIIRFNLVCLAEPNRHREGFSASLYVPSVEWKVTKEVPGMGTTEEVRSSEPGKKERRRGRRNGY